MIQIQEAILHVFNAVSTVDVISSRTLNMHDGVLLGYLENHIERGLKDPAAAHAKFINETDAKRKLAAFAEGEVSFVDYSQDFATYFFEELRNFEVEFNYHLFMVRFNDAQGRPKLAILVMMDKINFTHSVEEGEDGSASAALAIHRSIMPQPTQKAKGYAIVDLKDFSVRLFDFAIKFEKEKYMVFEDLVMGCVGEGSSRGNYNSIRTMTAVVCDEYGQDSVEAIGRAKAYIGENATKSDVVPVRELAEKVFPNSAIMQSSFVSESVVMNMPENILVEKDFALKQTASYKIVLDGDTTLTIPADYYNDPERFEMHLEKDGTTTITLKGFEKVQSK